jgi:hypothetical protein
LLYIGQVVKQMVQAILENLSILANLILTHGSALLMVAGLDILSLTALILILVLLTRIVKRKRGVRNSLGAGGAGTNQRAFVRLFETQRSPALKQCPNCSTQLPLSTIICDKCDYNFLAERPGRGQKLLSPPQPMTRELPEQKIAPAT